MSEVDYDVMVSIHCASMQISARLLMRYLESMGLNVWVCLDAVGGEHFRPSIHYAIKHCKLFLPLVNEHWAASIDCHNEYNEAQRMNLTSHEVGRTSRDEFRQPILLPVGFNDLRWDDHEHIELLAASSNFIMHDGIDFLCGQSLMTMESIAIAISKCGLAIQLPDHLRDNYSAMKITVNRSLDRIPNHLNVGSKYLGITTQKGTMEDGHSYEAFQTCELRVLEFADGKVTCEIERTELRKLVDGSSQVIREPPLPEYLENYLSALGSSRERATGSYDSFSGLLNLTGSQPRKIVPSLVVWSAHRYVLVAFDNRLAGPTFIIDKMDDRESEPGALILHPY